jgi:hypothetical protein
MIKVRRLLPHDLASDTLYEGRVRNEDFFLRVWVAGRHETFPNLRKSGGAHSLAIHRQRSSSGSEMDMKDMMTYLSDASVIIATSVRPIFILERGLL